MNRNVYTILYYFRKSQRDPDKGTIYARLTLNGTKIELCCTGVYVLRTDFDTKRQKVKNQEQNARLIQITSDTIYFIEHTENPTAEKIRDLINGKSSLNPTILKLLELYLSESNHNYAKGTLQDWKCKIGNLEAYLTETKIPNLEARRFTIQIFNQFKSWLLKKKSVGINHANKHGLKFRKALSWAVQLGHITENPLRDCELEINEVANLEHLTWDWVRKLRNYTFDGPLKKAVDLYIFSCCTGVCYADMMNLKTLNIEDDKELGLVITNKRQKNKSQFSTPLTGFAKELYREFGSLEAIPKITNQKMNEYIKIALCRIGYDRAEFITTHTGRKTFINHCLNDLEIDPYIVIRFTGHSSVEALKAYAKVKKKTSIGIFNKKLKEFESKN
jgi:integrase